MSDTVRNLTTMDVQLQKQLGAFYTERPVADFLSHWAVRDPNDKVLDPSCGDGVFIASAGNIARPKQVFGVDINADAISNVLANNIAVPADNLRVVDFFHLRPQDFGRVNAVIGNPPFVRYQRFNGNAREMALKAAQEAGVDLPEMSSSWAPFLVHATTFLEKGGRLAMVVPYELNHAAYAVPVIRHFLRNFASIQIIAFRHRLFPEISQDTFCLLADGFGQDCDDCCLHIANSVSDLDGLDLNTGTPIDIGCLYNGTHRIQGYLLPEPARRLYYELVREENVRRLGDLADVGIGYVTGANEYFHLAQSEVRQYEVPPRLLKRAVTSSKHLRGIRFGLPDWRDLVRRDEKAWLLLIKPTQRALPDGVKEYLDLGVANGISKTYKCSRRKPWFGVPHVYIGHAFLTYMSGITPRLLANSAGAVATNTLHIVTLHDAEVVAPEELAAVWQTSLTQLSCEIEGHALGGGMLKLEPSEAERVCLAFPKHQPTAAETENLDMLLRWQQPDAALRFADDAFLARRLGLTAHECQALRDGCELLKQWRTR